MRVFSMSTSSIGFDVLADIYDPIAVRQRSNSSKEKDVICEEIKDVFDTPGDIVHDYFAETLWNSHPLGQTIMGDAKGIRALQRRDLLDSCAATTRPTASSSPPPAP